MPVFDKIFHVMLRHWVFLLFWCLIVGSYVYLDKDVSLFFNSFHTHDNLIFFTCISNISTPEMYLIGLPVLAILFAYILHKKSWSLKVLVLWIFVLCPSLVVLVLKTIVGRARPIIFVKQHDFGFFGWHLNSDFWSFPSGHTTVITGLAIGLTMFFPRYFIYWASLCLLVMISRVMLAEHYLSDILASFYLVFLELGALIYIMRRKFPETCELILK